MDLPQPDGPSTATTEPAGTARSTWSTATVVAEAHGEVADLEAARHQNAPTEPTRSRWTANITAAVVAARTTDAAIAIPKFSAPGWPIRR